MKKEIKYKFNGAITIQFLYDYYRHRFVNGRFSNEIFEKLIKEFGFYEIIPEKKLNKFISLCGGDVTSWLWFDNFLSME